MEAGKNINGDGTMSPLIRGSSNIVSVTLAQLVDCSKLARWGKVDHVYAHYRANLLFIRITVYISIPIIYSWLLISFHPRLNAFRLVYVHTSLSEGEGFYVTDRLVTALYICCWKQREATQAYTKHHVFILLLC